MPIPQLRGVIFDMDGVMVDSVPLIKEAAVRMFAEKGYRVEPDDFTPFIGTGEARMLGGVAEKHGIPLDLNADKARTYALYLGIIPGRLKPLPGACEAVRGSRRNGLKVALASSADRIKVEGNLKALGLGPEEFDAVVTGCTVARKKPAPDLFLSAAEQLGLPASTCLVVEDAITGVAAAKAAGAWCLAVTTSFPADRLSQADWIAPDLASTPTGIRAIIGTG